MSWNYIPGHLLNDPDFAERLGRALTEELSPDDVPETGEDEYPYTDSNGDLTPEGEAYVQRMRERREAREADQAHR